MIDEFLTYIAHELSLSPNTVDAYRRDLGQWHDFATHHSHRPFEPEHYTAPMLRMWLAEIARQGAESRTLRRKAQSLRAFYRFLMKRHGLTSNPALELTLPRTPRELPIYVRPQETEAMLADQIDLTNFTEVRNRLILETLYQTGMRCSELISLLDVNVDTASGELKVLGKRNKERIIPFGDQLKQLISTYRSLRPVDAPTFFVRSDGRPLYRKLVYNVVHSAMQGTVHAGRMSPHVLRHSFATDMLNSGANLNSVQQLLGHASLATTQVYTHITYRDLQHNYQLAHPRAQKKGK